MTMPDDVPQMLVSPAWDTAEARAFVADLPRFVAGLEPSTVIHRARNTLYRCRALGRAVVIKHFQVGGNWWKRLAAHWGDDKATRSFRIAERLAALGVATPAPLAVLAIRRGRLLVSAYYVCDDVPHVGSLREVVQGTFPQRDLVITRFGTWAGKLHDAGVLHHDFNASNVLLVDHALTSAGFCLIDLNRLRFRRVGVATGLANLLQPGFFARDDAAILVHAYATARGWRPAPALRLYRTLAVPHRLRWWLKRTTRKWRRTIGF